MIKSKFEANFNFGHGTRSKFNTKTGKLAHQFPYNVQVVFGAKGNNLTFKNMVDRKEVSTADIEFDQR